MWENMCLLCPSIFKQIQAIHPSNLSFIPPRLFFLDVFFVSIIMSMFLGIVCVLFAQQHLKVKVDNRDPRKCDMIFVVTICITGDG